MPLSYFDFAGSPVRLVLGDDGLPERCELFDVKTGEFVLRDDLTPDVWFGNDARQISAEEFAQFLAKLRGRIA